MSLLGSTSSGVPDLGPVLQRSLTQYYALGGPRLAPELTEGLAQAYSLGGSRLIPRTTEVSLLIFFLVNLVHSHITKGVYQFTTVGIFS